MLSGARLRKTGPDGTWEVLAARQDGDDPEEQDDLDVLEVPDEDDELLLPAADPVPERDPLWERPPRSVRRYLLGTEKRLVCLRRHLVVLAEPVLTCVLALLGVMWLVERVSDVPHLPDLLFLAWLLLLGRAYWRYLQWRGEWFVATDKRLLLAYGVFKRRVAMMPLSKVTDMSYNRSVLGRLLGYGELVMESAHQDRALSDVNRLPMPDQVYVRICEQLFGEVEVVDVPRPVRAGVRRLARRALPSRFR
jgi:membrane protein YdbS with pleckstrin-like domain